MEGTGHARVAILVDTTLIVILNFICQVHDFATHEKEIDDIDFSPDSARLLSVSKDKVCFDAVVLEYWYAGV